MNEPRFQQLNERRNERTKEQTYACMNGVNGMNEMNQRNEINERNEVKKSNETKRNETSRNETNAHDMNETTGTKKQNTIHALNVTEANEIQKRNE